MTRFPALALHHSACWSCLMCGAVLLHYWAHFSLAADDPNNAQQSAMVRASEGPVTASLSFSPSPARLSDEPTLTLVVHAEPGVDVELPQLDETVGDFLVRSHRPRLPSLESGRQVLRQTWLLEPTRAGQGRIGPLKLRFTDRRDDAGQDERELTIPALEVEITTMLPQEAAAFTHLKGPQGPVPLPVEKSNWAWWLLGIFPLLACAAIWLRRRRQIAPVTESSAERARRELRALRGSERARVDVKQFYVELTGIIRRYLEASTGVRAPEQTTEEFLRDATKRALFSEPQRRRLAEFLESADLVKFAAHQPTMKDLDEAYGRAERFIAVIAERTR